MTDNVTTSSHARIPDVVPAGWLDRLLVAALDLPIMHGERAVVDAAVDAVQAIVPGCAVGVCLVPRPDSRVPEQIVIQRLPAGTVEVLAGIDPTRLFPGLVHEYVAPIPGSTTGSTLHVASDDDDLDRERSPTVHFIDRAALVLGRALANVDAIAAIRTSPHDARDLDQRLLQADKLANFGQIAAGVVHELNNPLTSIVAYSDYLIRKAVSGGGVEDPDALERLQRISESATRMLRFTRDLVSYSRPSSTIAGPVVLHSVIDQAVAFCEHVLSGSGVRLERRYGADVLTVRAVGEQLVQVFVNLLTNASQAAPPRDGCVVVTTALAEIGGGTRRVVIIVEDNGSGIAPEHLPHVFVPFFTTKRDMQGTGLGLSIVKSILDGHDGAIRVESDHGLGTRFVIDLPVPQRG
ncbi:MAG: ATP-binding protein [Myxococcota bacterium]|nr:ATP-binding protein [Myxococcota bacterium]